MSSTATTYSAHELEDSKPPAKKMKNCHHQQGAVIMIGPQKTKHSTHEELEDSKPPAKKTKRRRHRDRREVGHRQLSGGGNTALLSFDALFVMMEYLHPRDLLNTALTCKTLLDMLTTKLVVKSALIHGGHAKKSCEELYKLTSKFSIHVPSPLRLLRIANGKRCEICLREKVNHVRPGTGLFACWDCLTNKHLSSKYFLDHWKAGKDWRGFALTRPWKTSWTRFSHERTKYRAIFDHPRVAATDYGRNYYILSHHLTDRSGEKVGGIVAWENVDQIADHFESFEAMNDGGIDDYLTNNLNAPSRESYAEFNNTFIKMQQRADDAVRGREELKRARKTKTRESKIARAQKIVNDLTELIDENFREYAMKHAENSNLGSLSKTPTICMETPFIDDLLRPFIISPSSCKKNMLKELAVTINRKLNMITDKNLLAMNFLSDDDPFEAALKQIFLEYLPNGLESLFEVEKRDRHGHLTLAPGDECQNQVNNITGEFMDLLEADRLLGAMGKLKYDDFSAVLLTLEPTVTLARSTMDYDEKAVKKFINTVWRVCLNKERDKTDDARYGRAFRASKKMFGKAVVILGEYWAWLLEKYPENEERCIWQRNNVGGWFVTFDNMMKRDFEAVDDNLKYDWMSYCYAEASVS